MNQQLTTLVPFFKDSPKEIDVEFGSNHILKTIPKGQFIAMEGDDCKFLPIVKSGVIRIYTTSPGGNEMTLYRINKGESCILTITCLLTNKKFPALAYTETDTEILLVEDRLIREWVIKFDVWRNFVFNYMSNIIFKVLELLEDSKFNRTEIRLIEFLLSKYDINTSSLKYTHQQIANEIGTSREVISRILKDLESQNLIKLSRGSILITSTDKLHKKNLII